VAWAGVMSNDSASAGEGDLGLSGNEELRTGAASDEAFDPASDAGENVTSAEKSSLEVPDEKANDDQTEDEKTD